MRRWLAVPFVCLALAAQDAPSTGAASAPASSPTEPPSEPAFRFLATPPPGLPPMPTPVGYEPTEAMFELGRALFHDPILSGDRSVSCATCHPANTGFASPEPRPHGVRGQAAKRHAPSLWNRGYGVRQRWDGSSPSLEAFVLEPIADPIEMDLPLASALQRLADDQGYRERFAAVYGTAPDGVATARALATFVRGIVRGDAPYDRFLRGDVAAMSRLQRTGQWLFESKGGCWKCHTPPLFTDDAFHNTGIGVRDGQPEPGRAAVSGDAVDAGQWKTPTLRGVRFTAPYMHDGSLATLDLVVDFYREGGHANAHLDARLQPFELTEPERAALVAFLESL